MAKIKNPITIVSSGGSPTLISKTITQNGTFYANQEVPPATGYSDVTVNVPPTLFRSLVDGSITSVTAEGLAGVTRIGNSAFRECTSLVSVSFPPSVTDIRSDSFRGCTVLSNVVFASGLLTIGSSAFNSDALTEIILPDTVTTIGSQAFRANPARRLVIGTEISEIAAQAFYQCSSLENITIHATTPPTLADANAFASTGTALILVPYSSDHSILAAYKAATNWSTLESRLSEILNGTFLAFTSNGDGTCYVSGIGTCNQWDITIPSVSPVGDTVTGLGTATGNAIFLTSDHLVSISIPDSVEVIGRLSLFQCTTIKTIEIGTGVTAIYSSAFNGCTGLESVTIHATVPPTLVQENVFNNTTCKIYVPAASVNAYKAATNWSAFASRIQAIQE